MFHPRPTSGGRPRSFWRSVLRDVVLGFLQAIGILPLKNPNLPPGAYWAKDMHGRVELRAPAHRLDEQPPF